MKRGDVQLGFPATLYTANKAVIEALADVPTGSNAYALDNATAPFGTYNGVSWDWQSLSGHAAVTLDVNADTLLSLSTQELGLDTQTANTVLAGPASGVAAVPTFRALGTTDIPDLSGTYEPTLTKGNLTASSPLAFDNTRQVIGGAAAVKLGVSAADRYLYSTALDTWTEGTITADARLLLADADVPRLSTVNTWTRQNFIDGSADEIQGRFQAHSTQTANIITVEKSDGTVLAGFQGRGTFFCSLGTPATNLFIGNGAGNPSASDANAGNLALGTEALKNLSTGYLNVGLGNASLYSLTQGLVNTAIGSGALYGLINGNSNCAIGNNALLVQTGSFSTAIGARAGYSSNASNCIFIGYGAGNYHTTEAGRLILDGYIRASKAAEITNAILYGVMGATPDVQSLRVNVDDFSIGTNLDYDVVMTWRANTNNGVLTWMEDEDYFQFADDILLGTEKLYFGGTDTSLYESGDDVHLDTPANKTLVLDEVVYDDLRVTPSAFDRPGSSDPALVSVAPGGSGTTTWLYEFAKNDIACFTVQLPHSYKTGQDIKVHIHWTPGANGNEENGNTVGWKVDYTWANINGAFGSMSTADCSDACNGVDWEHNMTPDITIDGHTAAKGISSMLICNIKRTDTGADDTWSGTASGALPMILEIDFHFPIDTIGSRDWGSK